MSQWYRDILLFVQYFQWGSLRRVLGIKEMEHVNEQLGSRIGFHVLENILVTKIDAQLCLTPALRMTDLRIERLTSYDQFLALRADWDSLVESSVATIFLTHNWLDRWWQFYGRGFDLWILVVRDGESLIGLMPLVLVREAMGIRRLTFMGGGEVTPNHLNIIACPERFSEALGLICTYLLTCSSEWDFLDIDKLPAQHIAVDLFRNAFMSRGLTLWRKVTARCPYAVLPESFGLYLQSLGYSTRAGYRRVKRYLERDFPGTRFDQVRSEEELDEVFERLVILHQVRWTKKGYPGAFARDRAVEFHRANAHDALKSGLLRMYYLKVSGTIAAVYYCFRMANSVQYYIGGFDDRFAKYSPGMLITGYSIEQSIAEKASLFDFLEGDEGYKSHWASGVRENVRLAVFSSNLRGRLAHLYIRIAETAKELGVKFVPAAIRRPLWLSLQRLRAGG